MTTYRLLNDINQCHEAFVDFKALRRQFNDIKVWFPQENIRLLDKLKTHWLPVGVSFSSDKKSNTNPDISVWNLSCLVLSDKAYTALKPLLEPHGELLPLENGFFLFNCLSSIGASAVDAAGTSLAIEFEDGGNIPTALALKEELIAGIPIFKPGFLDNGFLICQDEFKKIVEDNKLVGVVLDSNLANIFAK